MLAEVCDYIKTVIGDFWVEQVDHERSDNVNKLCALDQVVLIGSDKGQIPNDQNDHSEMIQKLKFGYLL